MLAVSTGLESFLNPEDIGPMYPFVGAELVLVVLAFFLWLGWHFLQARSETRDDEEARASYAEVGLQRAMHHGGSALIASDDEWEQRRGRHGPDGDHTTR